MTNATSVLAKVIFQDLALSFGTKTQLEAFVTFVLCARSFVVG